MDLDISVQGTSFDDVRERLNGAIASYTQDVSAERNSDAKRLLSRRAPLATRLRLAASYFLHTVFSQQNKDREFKAGFDLPCRA